MVEKMIGMDSTEMSDSKGIINYLDGFDSNESVENIADPDTAIQLFRFKTEMYG